MAKIYLIGALKNPNVVTTANVLREAGHDVFDDWYSPGPETDQFWHQHCKDRGIPFREAIHGAHAEFACACDYKYLTDWAEAGVLLLPAGKSGHMELGLMMGLGKRCFVLFEGEPERWDLMYRLVILTGGALAFSLPELIKKLRDVK